MAKNYVGMVKWDKMAEATKYNKRAHADWRGYLIGMGLAIGSLVLYVYDGIKANKASNEFKESFDSTLNLIEKDYEGGNANEEEN